MKNILMLAAVLTALMSMPAWADDCGESTRVDLPDCVLERIWNNDKSASVWNDCHGRVKVKIDRAGGKDWTWVINSGDALTEDGSLRIRNITCCNASSQSNCNQSYRGVCRDHFELSEASKTCRNVAVYSASGDNCHLYAECKNSEGLWLGGDVNVSSRYANVLKNCDGRLAESCETP